MNATTDQAADKKAIAFDKLTAGLEALLTDGKWLEYFKFQARFHSYSFKNCMLIQVQFPEASKIAGFNVWKKLGRCVKKGEKGIYIFAPMTYKNKETETETKTLTGFKLVPVFDISQTEGEDLAQLPISSLNGDDQGLFDSLASFARSEGWSVSLEDTGAAGGYCRPSQKKIAIHSDNDPRHQAKTLAHEIGHALLHSPEEYREHRADFELEAESIAFLVLAHFGLDCGDYSFAYIAHWQSDKNALETLTKCGSRIQKTARQIIDGLEAQTSQAQKAA